MNFNRTILTMAVLSCITLSCSNDPVADDVYKMNKPVEEKLTYGLSVTLDGTKETGEYYLAASTNSLFNSRGEADNFTKDAFLFTVPFKDGKAVIADLKAYRNEMLFFNVLKKDGEDFQLSTNTGSELKYHPVFGLQQKTIDLSASPEAFVKQTLVQIEIPKAYLGKALFLIPSEDTEQFETDAKNGQQLNGDNYLKIESNTTQIPYYMVTPIKDIKYSLYVMNPNDELPFISKTFMLSADGARIELTINEEKKKNIHISITRGEEVYDKAEVYLIDAENWRKVDEQISKNHGNPEKGTYLFKQIANNGTTTFELYQTKGQRKLVVLVPKWNSNYYDSYEMREITIDSETNSYNVEVKADFNPSAGEAGITKEVTFNARVQLPEGYQYLYSNAAYAIYDSENISKVWNCIMGGEDYSAMATQGTVNNDLVSITCEVDTSKEIAIIVPVMKGFSFKPLVKRIKGKDIKGNSIDITVSEIENIY